MSLPAAGLDTRIDLQNVRVDLVKDGYRLESKSNPDRTFVIPSGAVQRDSSLLQAMESLRLKEDAPKPYVLELSGPNLQEVKLTTHSAVALDGVKSEWRSSSDEAALTGYVAAYDRLRPRSGPADKMVLEREARDFAVAQRKFSQSVADRLADALWQGNIDQLVRWLPVQRAVSRETAAAQKLNGEVAKAFHGFDDVFWRHSYDRLLQNLERAAGIFESVPGQSPLRGTGVFVGPSLVLTCAHVLPELEERTSTLVVYRNLGDPEPARHTYTFVRKLMAATELPATQPGYGDLALIEVAWLNPPAPLPKLRYPLEFGRDRLEMPVYVLAPHYREVAKPGIYDNAHILFPSKVKGPGEMNKVIAYAIDVYVRHEQNNEPLAVTSREVRRLVQRAYNYDPREASAQSVYDYTASANTSAPHPRLGFNTDTVAGNSGGGLFDKVSGSLIGVISHGVPDPDPSHPVSVETSWLQKESGVPAATIKAFLNEYATRQGQDRPDWPPLLLNPTP